jgi:formate dehydrogenase subunit gamma
MKRRDTIVRYTAPERINHWVTAFCFMLAAISGLGFFFPSFNWLMQIMGTPQLARILHPFVGSSCSRRSSSCFSATGTIT